MPSLVDFALSMSQPMPGDHKCHYCGSVIVRRPGPGRYPHYCNQDCRLAANPPRPVGRPRTRIAPVIKAAACWICGKPMSNRPRRTEGRQPTCHACTAKHGAGVCTKCGGPMRISSGRSTPPELRRCRACIPVRPKAAPGTCQLCEEPYVPRQGARPDQSFCSKSCKTAWQNGARPPYTRRADIGDAMMRKKARCRARHLRHAQTWDGITDDEILERDGWRCQIPGCKRRPIRKDASFPHPRSKSIDHIVPLSLGGDDTAANKRAAHLGCNVTRGNRMDFEQVALFGVIREPPLLTTTASGATTKLRPRKPCECGNEKPPGRPRCGACQEHQEAVAELRHQAVRERQHEAEERRRKKAADLAELIAQIDELRSRGLQSRTVAAKLGTSHRMVIRVGLRDPLTGKLPR